MSTMQGLRKMEQAMFVLVMLAGIAVVAIVMSIPLWLCEKICGKLGIVEEHDLD